MSDHRTDWLRSAPQSATSARAETPLFPFIAKLMRREDLTAKEATAFLRVMASGEAGSNQIAAALTALTAKGETAEELAGMSAEIRKLAVKVRAPRGAVDIAGTGSSAAKTFNVSTAAAIVAAGAGVKIVKQSNKGVTSPAGSIDLLAELGVKASTEPAAAQSALNSGICFLAAPKFHPELRRLADIRSRLGIRTCLNLLGLLANPGQLAHQLIGVWHPSLVIPMANALKLLGSQNAWVVHGEDGLDEITAAGRTHVAAVRAGEVRSYVLSPKDFGLKAGSTSHLKAAAAKDSARIVREVLASHRRDEARSLVVMNAAAVISIAGLAHDPLQAARMAEQSIDSGQAQNRLERLVEQSNKRPKS